MNETPNVIAQGSILEVDANLRCQVPLDDGSEVSAMIPRNKARAMFRIVPGDRIRVQI